MSNNKLNIFGIDFKVNIPEGFKLITDGFTITIVPEKKKELLTWEEIICNKPIGTKMSFITGGGNIGTETINEIDIGYYRGYTNTQHQSEKIRAIAQMMVIADYYNGDWKANWGNEHVEKHFVLWDMVKSEVYFGYCGNRSYAMVYFKTEELAKKAYANNKEIFETALKP